MLTHKVGDSGTIAFGAFKIGNFDLINRGGQTLDFGAVKVVVDAILVVAPRKLPALPNRTPARAWGDAPDESRLA